MSMLEPHQIHWTANTVRLEDRLITAGVTLKVSMSAVLSRIKRAAEAGDVGDLAEVIGNGIPDRHLPVFWSVAGGDLLLAAATKDRVELSTALIDQGVDVQMGLVYGEGRKPIAEHPKITLPIHEWARNGRIDLVARSIEIAGLTQLHVTGTDWQFTPMQMALACGHQDVALLIVEKDPRSVLDDVTNANTMDSLDRVSLEQHCATYKCPEFMDKVSSILAAKSARTALDEIFQDLGVAPERRP